MGNEGAHRTPILLPFGNRNTPAEPHRAVPCAAKPDLLRLAPPYQPGIPRHACRAFPGLPHLPSLRRRTPPDLAYQACQSLPSQTVPCPPFLASLPRPRSRQNSPSQPRLACRASPYRARPPLPATPVRPRLSLPADPCLPDHACQTLRFLDRSWPRHSVPANPAVQRHPFHACRSTPANRACPSAPSDACSALHARPSHPLVTSPAMPSENVPTRPCLPCLALARPHLASRALPRSASPTSPNQQRQASASTLDHALPARTGLARPCLRSHACRARPVQISPSPSKPCLPCLAQSHRIAHHRAAPRLPCPSRSRRAAPNQACLSLR